MTLKKYNQKRNFTQTPEPKGKVTKSYSKILTFVVQKHAASHLHYDFRLEMNGVLKSWAVPKGPCLDSTVKRLAVHVEDHPLAYGSFEGIIPKGEYGGGTVMVWDYGTWSELEHPKEGYRKGIFTFTLKGKKLKGKWKLIQIKQDPKNWLLIKIDDAHAKPLKQTDITIDKPLSAITKKSIDEISKNTKKVWHSNKSAKDNISDWKNTPKINNLPQIKPQLSTLVDIIPKGSEWLHEIKLDGYRLIARFDNTLTLITRGLHDWTEVFPLIAKELRKLKLKKTILDGEVVVIDNKGRSDFQQLQNHLQMGNNKNIVYYIFDLIYYKGHDLTELPLIQRKELLKKILENANPDYVRFNDHVIGEGEKVFKEVKRLNLEGIISKEMNSPYSQSRTSNWRKIKSIYRQEFVVGGYTKPQGLREEFGALLLGYWQKDELKYAGLVGTGFNSTSLKSLMKLLKKYKSASSPFKKKVPVPNVGGWVEPLLVIEVEFTEWTDEGRLRHPSFKGVRMDKKSNEVKKEAPKKLNKQSKKQEDGFHLTHPDKILYPEKKITKQHLADYYLKIAPLILPHIINRPLTLLRCPEGRTKQCFYQRHLSKNDNMSVLHKIRIDARDYIYIQDKEGLLQLAQMGVLEIHPWNCKIDNLNKPDQLIFDLDPGPGIIWPDMVKAAKLIKKELAEFDLLPFLKTTGGKGLHLVIPLKRIYSWENVIEFSRNIVQYLTQKYPTLFIDVMTKSKRNKKIFIDYLRNHKSATAIGVYSTRARENATIALPITWEMLTSKLNPAKFTIKTMDKMLQKSEKAWQDFAKSAQRLPKF